MPEKLNLLTDITQLKEKLSKINPKTLEELIEAFHAEFRISTALFNDSAMLLGLCRRAVSCKCYFLTFYNSEKICSIFDSEFVGGVLREVEVDKLCSFCCRLTSRIVKINDKSYTLVIFQYNLDTDNLGFNPENNPNIKPLYVNGESKEKGWIPNVLSSEGMDILFDSFAEKCKYLDLEMM